MQVHVKFRTAANFLAPHRHTLWDSQAGWAYKFILADMLAGQWAQQAESSCTCVLT